VGGAHVLFCGVGVASWWQKKPIIVLSCAACGGTFMRAARESHITVVKRLLDFFYPLFFCPFPLENELAQPKLKSFLPFSSFFNCDPHSFYCSLFILNSFLIKFFHFHPLALYPIWYLYQI